MVDTPPVSGYHKVEPFYTMHVFCPFSSCGHKATYEIVKPTKCPRCNKAYADAFKVTVAAPAAPVVHATVEDNYVEERPLTRSALAKARASVSTTAKLKPRQGRPEVSTRIMNAPAELPQSDDTDDGSDNDDYVDERVVRQRAQELAASIDPSTIIINDDADERTIKFGRIWDENENVRNAASKVKPAKKRGRR